MSTFIFNFPKGKTKEVTNEKTGKYPRCAAGKRGGGMTLLELSACYEESACLLRTRIVYLRERARRTSAREESLALERRVAALVPLWRESRELARITAHYYDGSVRK